MPVTQSFAPIADTRARLLVLGSMPGVASLVAGEYYAHPRNVFWRIMGEFFGAGPELGYEERCGRLTSSGVAVWDVLKQCSRKGSLDANIDRQSEVANDLAGLLRECPGIERVLFNGQKAESAYQRHVAPGIDGRRSAGLQLLRLPSTSPAHAGRSYQEKLAAWREALC